MFSASPDQTIRVWGVQPKGCAQVIRAHDGPVSGISLHATGDYLLSSGMDAVSFFLGGGKSVSYRKKNRRGNARLFFLGYDNDSGH